MEVVFCGEPAWDYWSLRHQRLMTWRCACRGTVEVNQSTGTMHFVRADKTSRPPRC